MKLYEQQSAFAQDVAKLLVWINQAGYHVTFGDAYRAPEMAALYAAQGKGINNSLHIKRLAIDLNLFDHDGKYLDTAAAHKDFGEYWEALNPLNKWGGRFPRQDGNHYQREYIEPGK